MRISASKLCLNAVPTLFIQVVFFTSNRHQTEGSPPLFTFQTNEYIFSLMEPKKVGKRRVREKKKAGNHKRNILGVKTETEHPEERGMRIQSNGTRGRIILGLGLSGKRLRFSFRGHGGVMEHWKFRVTQLADNQWHTLVLFVGHQVRLAVDCSSPQEM